MMQEESANFVAQVLSKMMEFVMRNVQRPSTLPQIEHARIVQSTVDSLVAVLIRQVASQSVNPVKGYLKKRMK